MPPRVSVAVWALLPPDLQSLFRFADIEDGLNREAVLARVPSGLNAPAALSGYRPAVTAHH
jgi:hypothetical protein